MRKPKKIIGYDGPSGAYVVADGQIKPLSDPSAFVALADAALLTSLGYSERGAVSATHPEPTTAGPRPYRLAASRLIRAPSQSGTKLPVDLKSGG